MKRKYEIVVKQYQMFDFDWDYDTPLTEDIFWNDVYHLGSDVEIDSAIVEWKEIIPEQETVIESTHPADDTLKKAQDSLQHLIDILWDYISEKDIPEITKRLEEE